jgi:hypothetical protein
MLNLTPDFQETLAQARSAARSMPGKCVEVIDVLSRLQGADMKALAGLMPIEMASLNHALNEVRNAAILLDESRRQFERAAL